jgi:hypothetical protein
MQNKWWPPANNNHSAWYTRTTAIFWPGQAPCSVIEHELWCWSAPCYMPICSMLPSADVWWPDLSIGIYHWSVTHGLLPVPEQHETQLPTPAGWP